VDSAAGVPSEDALITAIATVFDPEIPVNIYELGLIYAIEIADDGAVKVEMTLTAPACPSAQELPEQVRDAVLTVSGVTSCHVETVWDPPWDPSRMKCATLAWDALMTALQEAEEHSHG